MVKALELADWLDDQYDPTFNQGIAASELRRLHAVNEALLEALERVRETGVFVGAIAQEMMDAAIKQGEEQT